jgi:hypothetical protein
VARLLLLSIPYAELEGLVLSTAHRTALILMDVMTGMLDHCDVETEDWPANRRELS